ncbi:MAG: hypothetical protein CL908_21100 [Deltaproteobacteria bacterium]|nr:hypothetical protein [Deltaproteobacteria bacterium]
MSITFGVLNCNGRNTVTASARARHFASVAIDDLARDAAVGGGESLDALAVLLEVEEADRAAFARLAQRHFDDLFPTDRVTSDEMLQALDRVMREDTSLSIYARG